MDIENKKWTLTGYYTLKDAETPLSDHVGLESHAWMWESKLKEIPQGVKKAY